jgi:tetratricopeptide (TPR) repeat protein
MTRARGRGILRGSGVIPLALLAALAGCAHALKEPPSLTEVLGGARGHTAGEVDALLARGDALFAERTLVSARGALEDFTAAAAADPARREGLERAIAVWVWLTDHETESAARADAAAHAVQAAQWCGRRWLDDASCDYWLGAALGVQARERPSTGLSALPEIEAAFKKARERAPLLEEAGPDRALALLYLRAPGWPTGPGDPDLGLQHARRAIELKPDHPPNLLTLGEALAAKGDAEGSRAAYRRAQELAQGIHGPREAEAREWIDEATKALGE